MSALTVFQNEVEMLALATRLRYPATLVDQHRSAIRKMVEGSLIMGGFLGAADCVRLAGFIECLDETLLARTGERLQAEQYECVIDPDRYDEAVDMLDDIEARVTSAAGHWRAEICDLLTQRQTAREAIPVSAADVQHAADGDC